MDDFDEYISLEEVFEAYYECRRNKRKTFNALSFESDYEVKLVELWREINTETYEIGKSIAFVVTRPVKREVFAADFRDRVVHHLVVHRLEPLFEEVFIDDNYNCRKEKGVLYGVKRLYQQVKECSGNYTKDCYIAKCDLQGFFMSIHKPTLWRMLERFIWENYTGIDMKIQGRWKLENAGNSDVTVKVEGNSTRIHFTTREARTEEIQLSRIIGE